jgi:UDP-N-acetylglucosamine 2-epimerase (non-hydrolysing)
MRALEDRAGVEQFLVHTGQHYDDAMSAAFFRDLGLPAPDVDLGVGSGAPAAQIADVMRGLEPLMATRVPDVVVVVGDVNSTVAAALTAATHRVQVAHVEAGLRSFDRSMPEELNRVVTDRISDLLFVHSPEAVDNLLREGVAPGAIHDVGNTMIDTLVRLLPETEQPVALERLGIAARDGQVPPFALVTLHRPSNVDEPGRLAALMWALSQVASHMPVVFPVHPRTRARIEHLGLDAPSQGADVRTCEPMSYLDFLSLERRAAVVITDSGGVQEETTFLGIPCLTIRPNTERPITITIGTNRLVPDPEDLPDAVLAVLDDPPVGRVPTGWDGSAGERIADVLMGDG